MIFEDVTLYWVRFREGNPVVFSGKAWRNPKNGRCIFDPDTETNGAFGSDWYAPSTMESYGLALTPAEAIGYAVRDAERQVEHLAAAKKRLQQVRDLRG